MADKSNSTGKKEKKLSIDIAQRAISSSRGGWMNLRSGRTANAMSTNPLYATLNRRRGYNRGGLLSYSTKK